MSFSVNRSRPFRSLGLYRSSGKHAAPRGGIQWPRPAAGAEAHRPTHAASVPSQREPVEDKAADQEAAEPESAAREEETA
jgi:hypothetical protein